MKEEWKDKIVEWLKEEKPSGKFIDEHWEVKINDDVVIAESVKQPVKIGFLFQDNFVRLFITGILPTATMENNERLRIYRLLLLWNNKWNMVKFSLSGDEDEITIAVDLDLISLSKEEFNDALTLALYAMYDIIEKFGLQDIYTNTYIDKIVKLIEEKEEEGKSRKEIAAYLSSVFNVDEDLARKIVDEVLSKEKDEGKMRYMYG